MAKLADFAAGRPNPDSLQAAGFQGVIRYLANSPERGLPNKILLPEEAQAYKDRGMEIVSNWQHTKADYAGGWEKGVNDARAALDHHFACGGPGFRPIYFSVDADVDLNTWNSKVLPYLNGAASVIGKEWVGVYGGQRSMWWADDDGFRWRWQTKAWSRYNAQGRWDGSLPVQWVEGVQIHQERVDQDQVDGIGVDVNYTYADDYGQWSKAPVAPTPPQGGTVVAPAYETVWMLGNGGSSRNGSKCIYALIHTEQGGKPDGSGVLNLANYCQGQNGVSYHDIVGAGKLVHVVNDDLYSWSVLDANRYTYNLCFAGSYAEWSREQWLAREGDLRIAAWTIVEVCRRKGITVRTTNQKGVDGVSDHNFVTVALGIGNHTDVGKKFPWDKFEQFLAEYSSGAVIAPPVVEINMINKEAVRAGAWIGNRLHDGELDIPNGGKRAEFENGQIYWHPDTVDAHAIPKYLFESYAEYNWEAGFLGYPVADHTVLPGGEVQAFQNGVLYRQNGAEHGFYIHGMIYAAWRQAGYEGSIYGWPKSLEYPVGEGDVAQDFEHGTIIYAADNIVTLKAENGQVATVTQKH